MWNVLFQNTNKNLLQKILKDEYSDCLRKLRTIGSVERAAGSGRPQLSQNVLFYVR